jgi:alpha-N-arabinofuranosidase
LQPASATTASITVDPAFVIAPVNRRTFGSFVEHLGRCVYTGIFEPGHPEADENGFRKDVLALVRELGVSTVRYPGGNFVSGYQWEDGIGPVEQRVPRLDLAWHTLEPNTVGVDEFVAWSRAAEVEPMMAVNLGTRGVQEALDILEYCNVEGGSKWSDARRRNGAEAPHNIRMWCLGNEMDGPWQQGHKTAYEYGRLAAEAARAMRRLDPELELVACGSSNAQMETFATWERTVLDEAYDQVDFISAHAYYFETDGDLTSFLASAEDMEHFIGSVVATADHVRAAKRAKKRINISFDEWNVWYKTAETSAPPTGNNWPVAPALLEDRYNVADAVVVGSLLISLLRNSDRVLAASAAQLVNVIAPIMTEPGGASWRQTIFHPFAQASRYAAGTVLRPAISSPSHDTARFGDVASIDAIVTHDEAAGELAVFAVNRSTTDAIDVTIDLRGVGEVSLIGATELANPDPYLKATLQNADSVVPVANPTASLDGQQLTVRLAPVSWNVVRVSTR